MLQPLGSDRGAGAGRDCGAGAGWVCHSQMLTHHETRY